MGMSDEEAKRKQQDEIRKKQEEKIRRQEAMFSSVIQKPGAPPHNNGLVKAANHQPQDSKKISDKSGAELYKEKKTNVNWLKGGKIAHIPLFTDKNRKHQIEILNVCITKKNNGELNLEQFYGALLVLEKSIGETKYESRLRGVLNDLKRAVMKIDPALKDLDDVAIRRFELFVGSNPSLFKDNPILFKTKTKFVADEVGREALSRVTKIDFDAFYTSKRKEAMQELITRSSSLDELKREYDGKRSKTSKSFQNKGRENQLIEFSGVLKALEKSTHLPDDKKVLALVGCLLDLKERIQQENPKSKTHVQDSSLGKIVMASLDSMFVPKDISAEDANRFKAEYLKFKGLGVGLPKVNEAEIQESKAKFSLEQKQKLAGTNPGRVTSALSSVKAMVSKVKDRQKDAVPEMDPRKEIGGQAKDKPLALSQSVGSVGHSLLTKFHPEKVPVKPGDEMSSVQRSALQVLSSELIKLSNNSDAKAIDKLLKGGKKMAQEGLEKILIKMYDQNVNKKEPQLVLAAIGMFDPKYRNGLANPYSMGLVMSDLKEELKSKNGDHLIETIVMNQKETWFKNPAEMAEFLKGQIPYYPAFKEELNKAANKLEACVLESERDKKYSNR